MYPSALVAEEPAKKAPEPTPLVVGALQIASHKDLIFLSLNIEVTPDAITYDYKLKNSGTSPLALGASVVFPNLSASADETYEIPSSDAENPIDLKVQSDGKSVPLTSFARAVVMGVDRSAELKAQHIPLVPFSDETDKALLAASPETLNKLTSLGLLYPLDNPSPGTVADTAWSLDIVKSWTQTIDPGKTVSVTLGFAPIKASFTTDKTTIDNFDDFSDEVCETSKLKADVKALFKAKAKTVDLAKITLATDAVGDADKKPVITIEVRKPKPNSVVAFCGADEKTAKAPVVKGIVPSDNADNEVRLLIYTPSGP